jgi:hypothetical protein
MQNKNHKHGINYMKWLIIDYFCVILYYKKKMKQPSADILEMEHAIGYSGKVYYILN